MAKNDGKIRIGTEVDESGFKSGLANLKKGFSAFDKESEKATGNSISGMGKLKNKISNVAGSVKNFVATSTHGAGGLKGAFALAATSVKKVGTVAVAALKKTKGAFAVAGKAAVGFTKITVKAFSALGAGLATAVGALGKIGIEYNSEMETYTTNFKVMLGSTEAAAAKVEELKVMAAKTPFEMGDLAKGTQTLLAFNVANEKTTSVLQQLGDISLGNGQKLETLTRAYGKMNAAQKVDMESINMMIDSGFNPLLLVSEKTGESMTELYKRVSKGGVAFSEIEDAIKKATSEGGQFYKGMEEASKTTAGLMSTLKDNARSLVGEVFSSVSDGLGQDMIPKAIEYVEILTEEFRENGVEGMVAAATDILASLISTGVEKLPDVINMGVGIINSLFEGLNENMPTLAIAAVSAFMTFVNGFLSLLPTLISMAVTFISTLADDLSANPDKIIAAAGQIFASFVNGIIALIPSLLTLAIKLVISLAKYLWENKGKIWETTKELGKAIVEGLWNGIKDSWNWLVGKVKEVAKSLLDGAKEVLGIHSPSKEFARIGEFSADGVAVGFEKKNPMKKIQKIIKKGLKSMDASLQPTFTHKGMSSRNEYYNQTNTTNIYGDVTDPDVVARKMRLEQRYGLAGAK